ncbi:MAG: DUF3426 domain-containing protein [Gammaproteobacteria bacterium]|nr:DUF3426 domain-containing protein [Gammaproteobacteria bacterium]
MEACCPYCQIPFSLDDAEVTVESAHLRCHHCKNRFASVAGVVKSPRQQRALAAAQPYATALTAHQPQASRVHKRNLLPGFLLLPALLLLAWQLLYLQRYRIAPDLLSLLPPPCRYLFCDLPAPQEMAALQIVTTLITLHPDYQGALLLQGELANHAPFAQPSPDLLVTLSDINSQVIAQRRFSSSDYTVISSNAPQRFASHSTLQFELALLVDEQQVVGYELQLLPSAPVPGPFTPLFQRLDLSFGG